MLLGSIWESTTPLCMKYKTRSLDLITGSPVPFGRINTKRQST